MRLRQAWREFNSRLVFRLVMFVLKHPVLFILLALVWGNEEE